VVLGKPGVPLICWALTVTARKQEGGRAQIDRDLDP
jgi:hypothetical protein